MTDAAPDWNSIPAGIQIRVARYEDSNGVQWSASAWRNEKVGRQFQEKEIANAWGATADESIAGVIAEVSDV